MQDADQIAALKDILKKTEEFTAVIFDWSSLSGCDLLSVLYDFQTTLEKKIEEIEQ